MLSCSLQLGCARRAAAQLCTPSSGWLAVTGPSRPMEQPAAASGSFFPVLSTTLMQLDRQHLRALALHVARPCCLEELLDLLPGCADPERLCYDCVTYDRCVHVIDCHCMLRDYESCVTRPGCLCRCCSRYCPHAHNPDLCDGHAEGGCGLNSGPCGRSAGNPYPDCPASGTPPAHVHADTRFARCAFLRMCVHRGPDYFADRVSVVLPASLSSKSHALWQWG